MTLEQLAGELDIDLGEVLDRLVNNRALMIRLLKAFATDTTDIRRAQKALDAEDYRAVAESLHSMKGGAVSLGLHNIEMLCADVIQAVCTGRLTEVSVLLDRLQREYTRTSQLVIREDIQ